MDVLQGWLLGTFIFLTPGIILTLHTHLQAFIINKRTEKKVKYISANDTIFILILWWVVVPLLFSPKLRNKAEKLADISKNWR